jgi:hypothetical protein
MVEDPIMKGKVIGIIGGVAVSLILLVTVVVFAMGNDGPTFKKEIPTMEEIPEETIHLDPTPEVMVGDQNTVYWPILGPSNSTEIILVTGVQVHLTWSDDESAPALRPMYQNMPDTMTLQAVAVPLIGSGGDNSSAENGTLTMTGRSDTGSTRIDMDLASTPVMLEEGTDTNISFNPDGAGDPGNSGLYLSVSCEAGDLEASRPALLLYNDMGDEVTLTISVTIKRIPAVTFEQWYETQNGVSEW